MGGTLGGTKGVDTGSLGMDTVGSVGGPAADGAGSGESPPMGVGAGNGESSLMSDGAGNGEPSSMSSFGVGPGISSSDPGKEGVRGRSKPNGPNGPFGPFETQMGHF